MGASLPAEDDSPCGRAGIRYREWFPVVTIVPSAVAFFSWRFCALATGSAIGFAVYLGTYSTLYVDLVPLLVIASLGVFAAYFAEKKDRTNFKLAADAKGGLDAKSVFLANQNHEFRTPLNGIVGMVELLSETELTDAQREYVGTLRFCSESLLAMVNDILDLEKALAGKLQLEAVHLPVRACVDRVCNILSVSAAKAGVALAAFTDPEIPIDLLGDPNRLAQIILNLGANAIKFSAQRSKDLTVSNPRRGGTGGDVAGQVLITATVATRSATAVRVAFTVADNGIGIPRAAQSRLFQPFNQGARSTAREYGGTGLGLAICKTFAEAMGGSIAMISVAGRGTTLRCEVPLLRQDARLGGGEDSVMPRLMPSPKRGLLACTELAPGLGPRTPRRHSYDPFLARKEGSPRHDPSGRPRNLVLLEEWSRLLMLDILGTQHHVDRSGTVAVVTSTRVARWGLLLNLCALGWRAECASTSALFGRVNPGVCALVVEMACLPPAWTTSQEPFPVPVVLVGCLRDRAMLGQMMETGRFAGYVLNPINRDSLAVAVAAAAAGRVVTVAMGEETPEPCVRLTSAPGWELRRRRTLASGELPQAGSLSPSLAPARSDGTSISATSGNGQSRPAAKAKAADGDGDEHPASAANCTREPLDGGCRDLSLVSLNTASGCNSRAKTGRPTGSPPKSPGTAALRTMKNHLGAMRPPLPSPATLQQIPTLSSIDSIKTYRAGRRQNTCPGRPGRIAQHTAADLSGTGLGTIGEPSGDLQGPSPKVGVREPPACARLVEAEPRRVHALCAEDNAVNRKVLGGFLKTLNINMTFVENGLEAVEAYRARCVKFDIVFMDIEMPIMDGLEATRVIREIELTHHPQPPPQLETLTPGDAVGRTGGIPIVACTANALKTQRDAALSGGFNAYITKPFKRSDIANLISSLCTHCMDGSA